MQRLMGTALLGSTDQPQVFFLHSSWFLYDAAAFDATFALRGAFAGYLKPKTWRTVVVRARVAVHTVPPPYGGIDVYFFLPHHWPIRILQARERRRHSRWGTPACSCTLSPLPMARRSGLASSAPRVI